MQKHHERISVGITEGHRLRKRRAGVGLALGVGFTIAFASLGFTISQSLVLAAPCVLLLYLLWVWETMRRWWTPLRSFKNVAATSFFGVVVFLFLRYGGRFSISQSLSLAIAFAYVNLVITQGDEKPDFEPYWISVSPNWYEILHDHHIVENQEEWNQIAAALSKRANPEYNVLRNGIRFTVLKSPRASKCHLIFRQDVQGFWSRVDFREMIDTKTILNVLSRSRMPPQTCELSHLYLKWTVKGYEIGIICHYREEIKLALLPFVEFEPHYDQMGWEASSFSRRDRLLNEFQATRTNLLASNGWTIEHLDIGEGWSREYVKHKYFSVEHHRI